MKRLLIFPLMLLTGCATAYKPMGFTGGYSENKLQDNVYQISFWGNAYTRSEKVRDFALLRASEVALENGYKYFVLVEGKDSIKTQTYTTPMQANTYGLINLYGNTGTYRGTTYFSGGQIHIYNKPRTSLTIQCFQEKPETDAFVYDAEQIKENLRNKYKLK